MIELRNVTFGYDERVILEDISFTIGESESAIIMGPSGSGKSTILRLLLGLNYPQRGDVLIDGMNLNQISDRDLEEVRKSIGMVFQDGALFDSLTVGENVGYYLFEHTKQSTEEIETAVREMLGFVGLDADQVVDQLPEQLSGGMQRRVAIARALLATNPKIMLYDEPTTGLDPQATDLILRLVNKLTEEKGISTIVVTHQISDAFFLADRFLVIFGGRLIFDGTIAELRDSDQPQVRAFLAPYRQSLELVESKGFRPAQQ